MKILSLFDGISCARVALERAGIPVEAYYASEVDKYAMQISAKNYPDIIQLGSVTNISVAMDCYDSKNSKVYNLFHFVKNNLLASVEMPKIDLLIGGSPCQDLSIAKKNRKGLDGERSGLFWEYVRILKEVKPKYFILENVNSMPKEAKALITETLGVEPIMINAALVSAQNRKRLFWIGERVDTRQIGHWDSSGYEKVNVTQPEDRGIFLKDILEQEVDEKYTVILKDGNEKLKSNTVRSSGRGSGIDDKHNWDTIRIGQIGKGGQGNRIYSPKGKSVALSANSGGKGPKTGLYAIPVALRNRGEGKKPEYNGTDKANSMTTVQTDSMVEVDTQIRKLTPIECERLQGVPDNYTEGASNSQRYKMLGNAFNVDVVSHILSHINNLKI